MATRNVAPRPEEPPEEPAPDPAPTDDGPTFKPEFRSALDDPSHPLHHLRNA